MPALNADVTLEISAAQGEVDALAAYMQSALGDAIGSFDSTFAASLTDLTAQVTALTEALQTGLQSAASDATAVGDALDAGIQNADGDVQNLSDSVSSLGDSASSAGGDVQSLGDHTGALAGGAALATGSVGGLKGVAGDLAPSALGAAGGVLALSGGILELYKAGLDATSAEERFNAALKEQAKLVEQIHIGDLDTSLTKLAADFGSTTAAMQNAVATTFQFAQNAGASRLESTHFSQELFVLAARAVSLKPSLGDVADVATRMEIGLGRARSAAQQFGISISQAEINDRAMSDTGKESAATLTAYEKSVAGAEIAVERYGSTLKTTLSEGAQNAAIQQRALTAELKNAVEEFGKPLVAPMLDAIRAGLPDIKEFGAALGEIAQVVLPPLATVLRLIGPAIQPAVIGFAAFYVANVVLPGALALTAGALEVVGTSFVTTAVTAETAAGEIAGASAAIEASAGPIGLAVAGLTLVAGAFGLFGGSAHNATDEAKKFADQLEKTADIGILAAFNKQLHDMGADLPGIDRAKVSLEEFKLISEGNVGVGQRLIDAMENEGIAAGKYQAVLDRVVQKQAQQKSAADETKAALDALNTKQIAANSTLDNATGFTLAAASAANDYYDALTKETSALDAAADRITALNDKSFAVTHAQKAAADAVDAYTKSLTDGKSTQLEQNDALATAQESFEKVGIAARSEAEANDTSGNAAHAAAAGQAAQIAALQKLADTLDDGSPLKQGLLDYIAKLNSIPPTVYTNVFITGTAQQQLDEINRTIDEMNKKGISIPVTTTSGGFTGLMAGGPAAPNTTYWVGEAGPELFTTGPTGGYVTPNSMILGATGAQTTSSTQISVTVQVTAAPGMTHAEADDLGSTAGAAAAREIRSIVGAL